MGDIKLDLTGVGEPDPAMPTIVLKAANILVEIKVRSPKKPSRWRKALT